MENIIPEELYQMAKGVAEKHGNDKDGAMKHSLYAETITQYQKMAIHFEWDTDPRELILTYRPHETKWSADYRIETYEQSTYAIAQKILNLERGTLSNSQLYSIDYPKSAPELSTDAQGAGGIKEYLEKNIPIPGKNLEKYFWEFLFQMIMIDPNGWIAVRPKVGDPYSDPNQFRSPFPVYIPSANILEYSSDYVAVLSTEHRAVKNGDSEEWAPIIYYFTPDITFQCIPVAYDDGEFLYEPIAWHVHYSGEMAIRQIGGVISGKHKSVMADHAQAFHLSHLQPAIPAFNRALRYLSDIESMFVNSLHPIKYGMPTRCHTCNGMGDIVIAGENGESYETCPTCNGDKVIVPTSSPLEGYTVQPGDDGKIHAPVNFVAPPIDSFKEAIDFYFRTLDDALRALDMDILVTKASPVSQTARAKEIDRESLHAHFRKVANTTFPLYQWILDRINQFRYPALSKEQLGENRVEVVAPGTFDTTKSMELLEQIKDGMETGFSRDVLVAMAEKVIDKIFGAETKASKLNKTYIQIDPYALVSSDEKVMMMSGNGQDLDNLVHKNMKLYVEAAIEKEGNRFLDYSTTDKREIIYELAKVDVKPNVSTPPQKKKTLVDDPRYDVPITA